MGNLNRRIEHLETVAASSGTLGRFTQEEASKIARWAGDCAHHYLQYRFYPGRETPAFEGVTSADHPFIIYKDACCKALGIEMRRYSREETIELDPEWVIKLLPSLESFFHVPGNATWEDRRAWWIRLREDQIPAKWEYYRSCRPAPNHDPDTLQ